MVVTVGRGFCAKLEEDLTEAEVPLELELSVEGEGDYLFACLGLDSEGRLYGDDYVIWEEHPASQAEDLSSHMERARATFTIHTAALPEDLGRLLFTISPRAGAEDGEAGPHGYALRQGGEELWQAQLEEGEGAEEPSNSTIALTLGRSKKGGWQLRVLEEPYAGDLLDLMEEYGADHEEPALEPAEPEEPTVAEGEPELQLAEEPLQVTPPAEGSEEPAPVQEVAKEAESREYPAPLPLPETVPPPRVGPEATFTKENNNLTNNSSGGSSFLTKRESVDIVRPQAGGQALERESLSKEEREFALYLESLKAQDERANQINKFQTQIRAVEKRMTELYKINHQVQLELDKLGEVITQLRERVQEALEAPPPALATGSGEVVSSGGLFLPPEQAGRKPLPQMGIFSPPRENASQEVLPVLVKTAPHSRFEALSQCEIGADVTFGQYPQEEDGAQRPIEWLVLDKQGDTVYLLSKYGLDSRPFHNGAGHPGWEECDVQRWLNGRFFAQAFDKEEQKCIVWTRLTNKPTGVERLKEAAMSDSFSKVFLPSTGELLQLFPKIKTDSAVEVNPELACRPTPYALAHGAVAPEGTGDWWLRSACSRKGGVVCINALGALDMRSVGMPEGMVRPAIRVKLETPAANSRASG